MNDYIQRTENLREDLVDLKEEVSERNKELIESYMEDEERTAYPEGAGIEDSDRPEGAKGMYMSNITGRAQRDEADNKEEYLALASNRIGDAREDLELAFKQLEKASKRIDTLEEIHGDLKDVSYIMYAEYMYIDFVWTIRHILDEIVQNFRTSGEEEIGEYEPFGEGGFEINVIKPNEALLKERKYKESELEREEVDWSIDTDEAERGDFNKLRSEHFEGLKAIAHELQDCRNELDSALLITARRIGTSIEDLEKAEENMKKAKADELLQECSEIREGLEKLRKSIERETLEPLDDGLRRCEIFIQDLIEGNSDEIARVLDGGNWWTRSDDGMLEMSWDKPEIYKEDEEDSEA